MPIPIIIIIIIIIIIFSIVPIWNTGLSGIILKTDAGFPIDIGKYYSNGISTWSENLNFGSNVIHLIYFIKYKILFYPFYLLIKLGLSTMIVNRLLYFIAFFSLISGSYLMLRQCFNFNRFISITGAIISVYNPFIISTLLLAANWAYLLTYSSIFFILFYLDKLIKEKKKLFLIPLSFFLFLIILNNYIIVILGFITIYLFLTKYKMEKRLSFLDINKLFILILLLFIFINTWIILPQAVSILSKQGTSYTYDLDRVTSENSLSKKIDTQLFFLVWESKNTILEKDRYYNFFTRFTFLPVLGLIILSFILSKEYFFKISFLIYLIFSFLAKGAGSFFGFIYIFLFKNIPYFSIFRDSGHFLEISLIFFIISLAFSINYYLNCKNKMIQRIIPFLIVILLLLSVYPIFSGNLLGALKSTDVPSEYFSINELTKGGRILFPGTLKTSVKYTWTPAETVDISNSLFDVPVISYFFSFANLPMKEKTDKLFINIFENNLSKQELIDYLKKNRIKFILFDYNLMDKHPLLINQEPPDIKKLYNVIKDYHFKEYNYGNLTLVQIYDSEESFLQFCGENIEKEKVFINIYKINLNTKKDRTNCTLDYFFTFDSNWILLKENSLNIQSNYQNQEGFNSWEVKELGNYYLFYMPDIIFIGGIIISGTTLFLCIVYLLYDWRKQRRKKNIEVY